MLERGFESLLGFEVSGFSVWHLLKLVIGDRLAGLVVKASVSGAEDPGFESRLRRDFFRVESYQ